MVTARSWLNDLQGNAVYLSRREWMVKCVMIRLGLSALCLLLCVGVFLLWQAAWPQYHYLIQTLVNITIGINLVWAVYLFNGARRNYLRLKNRQIVCKD